MTGSLPILSPALRSTLASTQALVNNLNHGLAPAMQRLPAIAAGLEDSVKRTDKLIGSLDSGYGGDSNSAVISRGCWRSCPMPLARSGCWLICWHAIPRR